MMKQKTIVGAIAAMAVTSTTWAAPIVNIEGLDFDLAQFTGAFVQTDSSFQDGRVFDNVNGIDGFTLGELAVGSMTDQFSSDPGDFLTLQGSPQEFLKLTYPTPIIIGSGDASLFVVYELASGISASLDAESQSFEISFNGGSFLSAASVLDSSNSRGNVTGTGGEAHNQVAFDLTASAIGFSVGDTLSTVEIRNLGVSGRNDDPDFMFAARAGTTRIPEPTSLALLVIGTAAIGVGANRRRRRVDPARAKSSV